MPAITHTYEARISEPVDGELEVVSKTVAAAYFVEEGDFTVFKDTQHGRVFSVRSERLLTVERIEES